MLDAISNTSPLLYLHRINALDWLPQLFGKIWTSNEVVIELEEGRRRGFDVPERLRKNNDGPRQKRAWAPSI